MNRISVIVPVYNSEAFIRQCIQSLLDQTCLDWEALLIDDGSTDSSLAVCEELSRADSRVKVYHQENKGVSAARNYGLDLAEGEYVYFLDSDDAIHPLLFEEMLRQVEEQHVEMAFCNFVQMDDRQLDEALAAASVQDERPQWQIGDGEESERWFHIDHTLELGGVSGMISRNCIGALRFDESLPRGEDTMFKYCLFSKQVRTAYSSRRWYYYRVNSQSLTHSTETMAGDFYSKLAVQIRNSEAQKGHMEYAERWEIYLAAHFRQSYVECKAGGNLERCEQIKGAALRECLHPLFRSVGLVDKILFHLCFQCHPLYILASWAVSVVLKLKRRL